MRARIEHPWRPVRILYLGDDALRVRGTYTGRLYSFSPRQRSQRVDVDDSRVLLRSRFFRRG